MKPTLTEFYLLLGPLIFGGSDPDPVNFLREVAMHPMNRFEYNYLLS